MKLDSDSINKFIQDPSSYKLKIDGETIKAVKSWGPYSLILWFKTHIGKEHELYKFENVCNALSQENLDKGKIDIDGLCKALNIKIQAYSLRHKDSTTKIVDTLNKTLFTDQYIKLLSQQLSSFEFNGHPDLILTDGNAVLRLAEQKDVFLDHEWVTKIDPSLLTKDFVQKLVAKDIARPAVRNLQEYLAEKNLLQDEKQLQDLLSEKGPKRQ